MLRIPPAVEKQAARHQPAQRRSGITVTTKNEESRQADGHEAKNEIGRMKHHGVQPPGWREKNNEVLMPSDVATCPVPAGVTQETLVRVERHHAYRPIRCFPGCCLLVAEVRHDR